MATARPSSSVEAQDKIHTTLLALARSIRRPRTYVGYSAFILMGLVYGCRPFAWEGPSLIDLIKVFAPWAEELCTQECPVQTIPCALVATEGCSVECAPISQEYPLHRCVHYIAGINIPKTARVCPISRVPIAEFYASLGVSTILTVADGDCAFDVMAMILARPTSFETRKTLRVEISDYLLERIDEPWMHDLMEACQELPRTDVAAFRAVENQPPAPPIAPATAVAEENAKPSSDDMGDSLPDEETLKALQWASRLQDDANVISLFRSLPQAIINDQVELYRRRSTEPAVAAGPSDKVELGRGSPGHKIRMLVAMRFHTFCRKHHIIVNERLPRNVMKQFVEEHIKTTLVEGFTAVKETADNTGAISEEGIP